ncbi:MAG: hypothetical protein EBQ92_04860 [Proteobacteria bacterium]|nr:hypothetical protein [Pseudomonadota bacterium]
MKLLFSLVVGLVFHPLTPTTNAKWNEAIPANKETPTVREVYAHRAPWEDGVVYVDGQKVSKMTTPAGTIAHELIHGINGYLRSLKSNKPAFYVPFHGAFYFEPTRAKRVQIAQFIPMELRGIEGNAGGRFHDYIQTKEGKEPDAGTYFDPSTGKKLWGETDVFYIWDEWNAYIYGGRTDLEAEALHGKECWDSMTGPVEFMIYSLGGMMAIKQCDATYFQSPAFQDVKTAFIFLAEETMRLLSDSKGSSLQPEKSNRYLDRLRTATSKQASEMRDFIRQEFGDSWSREVLGI